MELMQHQINTVIVPGQLRGMWHFCTLNTKRSQSLGGLESPTECLAIVVNCMRQAEFFTVCSKTKEGSLSLKSC